MNTIPRSALGRLSDLSDHDLLAHLVLAAQTERHSSSTGLPPAELTLASIKLLAPHLTPENHADVLTRARHQSKREVELLVAAPHPRPDVPAIIFDRALTLLVTKLERSKTGATTRPRTTGPGTSCRANAASRHVPAPTKRIVSQRDGGRCAFTGPQGRCPATTFLEYHHVVPFAAGGEMSAKNLELRCRAHNQYEAEKYFGPLQVPMVREERAVYGVIANSFQERVGSVWPPG